MRTGLRPAASASDPAAQVDAQATGLATSNTLLAADRCGRRGEQRLLGNDDVNRARFRGVVSARRLSLIGGATHDPGGWDC